MAALPELEGPTVDEPEFVDHLIGVFELIAKDKRPEDELVAPRTG